MSDYKKDELLQKFKVAQVDYRVRNGEGVMQDYNFVSNQDIEDLTRSGQRLAGDHEPSELLYLDDKRCVRVCAIEAAAPVQIAAVAEGTHRDQAQNSAPSTMPRRPTIAVPVPAPA